jgi:hypothetical protein
LAVTVAVAVTVTVAVALAGQATALVVSVSQIPGTGGALAAGYVYANHTPSFSEAAVILQYS